MPSVLIVDDEPMICSYLSLRYRREGYKTITAQNGEEALELCKQSNPDLIVTDLNMPILNGKDLIKELNNSNLTKPFVICMTAYSDLSLEELNKIGADALFSKPFNVTDIIIKSKDFLDHLPKNKDSIINTEKLKKQFSIHNQIKMLAEVSTGVIHNINNHITFISTSSSLLKKYLEANFKGELSEEQKKIINIADKIHNHSTMIAKIIRSIRALAYPNSQIEGKENFPLLSLVQNACDLLEDTFKGLNIKVKIDIKNEMSIYCYPEQVLQVLLSLFKNSYESISESKSDEKWIQIECKDEKDYINLEITDSGAGVPLEYQDKIGSSFFTTKKREKGIGLGLNLSKKIMEFHNGSIEYEKQSKNTKFILKFKKSK